MCCFGLSGSGSRCATGCLDLVHVTPASLLAISTKFSRLGLGVINSIVFTVWLSWRHNRAAVQNTCELDQYSLVDIYKLFDCFSALIRESGFILSHFLFASCFTQTW